MKFDREEITKRLLEKKAVQPCHRCGETSFIIIDGFSDLMLHPNTDKIGKVIAVGPTLPVVIVACEKCGAITPHALGGLGLMPKQESKNE